MKTGDKLRITEKLQHKPTQVKTGEIIQVDRYKITIEKENSFKESFNVADLVARGKKIELDEGEGFNTIKIRLEGERYVLCKGFKSDNRISNGNSEREDKGSNGKEPKKTGIQQKDGKKKGNKKKVRG